VLKQVFLLSRENSPAMIIGKIKEFDLWLGTFKKITYTSMYMLFIILNNESHAMGLGRKLESCGLKRNWTQVSEYST
jgi:hypothetical protein